FLCFFFQAEAGIRDATVTGVQTCALPISPCCPLHAGLDRGHHECRRFRARLRGLSPAADVENAALAGGPAERGRRRCFGRFLERDRKSVVEGKRGEVGGEGGWRERRDKIA